MTTTRVAVFALAMTGACARQVPATKATAAPADYLGVVELLDRLESQAGGDRGVERTARQMLGMYSTFIGEYQEALAAFHFQRPDPVAFDSAALARHTPDDALDGVTRLAAGTRAVFIN